MSPFDLLAHTVRAKEIFAIPVRDGFADLLQQAGAPSGLWRKVLPEPAHRRTTNERIRMAAEELGPAFVTFGQLMSMRPYSEMMPVLDADCPAPRGGL